MTLQKPLSICSKTTSALQYTAFKFDILQAKSWKPSLIFEVGLF